HQGVAFPVVRRGELTMSQGPFGSDRYGEVPPSHPLDDLWYLQGETEALGPYKGHAIKAMIDAGSVGAGSLVAKVGASHWSAVADVPAFAVYLPGGEGAPLKYAGFWMRLLAFVIDWLLLNIIAFAAAAIIGFIIGFAAGASGGGTGSDFDTLMRVIGALVGL